jgi:hypothetical protein
MATTIPAPVLDERNGDLVTAEAIASLPAELSDRSASNPAVTIIEAMGAMFDKLIYQINRWPRAVIQKVLALLGVTLNAATAATAQQTFVLSTPQPKDTVIPTGSRVSTSDGVYVFATTQDATIPSFRVGSGTITVVSGSMSVAGSSTLFLSEIAIGDQISPDRVNWYTIVSIPSNISMTLSAPSATGILGTFWTGRISTTTSVRCSDTGVKTNITASAINTLVDQPPGVASTYNAAAATGGADEESINAAIARCPQVLTARDVALSASDFEYHSTRIMGTNSRAKAFSNTNIIVPATGYVTVALLSPSWTSAVPVTGTERINVVRDLLARMVVGSTLLDIAADIQAVTPAVAFWRKASVDETTARLNVAVALNNFLNPSTYTWGRTIYTADLVAAVQAAHGVDRVHSINGIPAVGMIYNTPANPISFTQYTSSATANAADIGFGKLTEDVSYLIDAPSKTVYLVTSISGTTLNFDSAYQGVTGSASLPYLNAGDKFLTSAYTLPYASLSSVTPAPSIQVVGVV